MTTPVGEGDESDHPDDSTLKRLLDIGVFAPLGFVIEYRSVVPKLTEAGRRQIEFTRSLGRAALRTIARGASTGRDTPPVRQSSRNTPVAAVEHRSLATAAPEASTDAEEPSHQPSTNPAPDEARQFEGIAGYHEMTARDIVAVVTGSDLECVEWIAESEAAGKARVTVLRAAAARRARLQGG